MSNSYKFVWLSFENTQNDEEEEEEEDDSRVAFGPLWYESGHDNAQEHIGIGESHFRWLQARFSTDCNPANLSAFAKSLFLELLGFWSLHQRQSWSHQNDFGYDDNGLGKDWDSEDNLDEGENPPDFYFNYVVILINVICVVILVRNKFILTMVVLKGRRMNIKRQNPKFVFCPSRWWWQPDWLSHDHTYQQLAQLFIRVQYISAAL